MKRSYSHILIAISILLVSSFATAETFPSYLNEKYCTDIKLDFMTSSIRSLQQYRQQQLASQHRGGMNNIRNYLVQRQEWLTECDKYMSATSKQRLFRDDTTSNNIFKAIGDVSTELNSLIKGVSYTAGTGESPTGVAAQKFDRLFKLVDEHQTLMLMKGQVVYR